MNRGELARRISERRKELGLTQAALAHKAAVSRNYVALIERGEARNPSLSVLHRLATALGIAPAVLIGQSSRCETVIPPALREFSLEQGLSFKVIDWLSRIPGQGREPKTVEEWRRLYDAVHPYLGQEKRDADQGDEQ